MKILNFKLKIIFLFSFFLLSTFYLLFSATFANAASQTHSTSSGQANYPVANTNSNVPNNLHNWTQNVMIEVISALTCQLAGVDPTNPKQSCLGIDSASGKIGFLPKSNGGGAIGFMGNMISVLYTPPLHTGDYFKDLASNFGISKKTYAQTTGTGFQSLTPLIGVWSAFRNIVYLFLVIIFVVIGLAIMLRVKIDPRTVMTIQNQIPKIIIGILAVTFSFAIAGFLIDLMYILSYLFVNIIAQADPKIATDISKIVQSTNPFQAANESFRIGGIITGSASSVGGFFAPVFDNGIGRLFIGAITGIVGKLVGSNLDTLILTIPGGTVFSPIVSAISGGTLSKLVGNIIGGASFGLGFVLAPQIAGFIGGVIAWIIISIALLVALFRLWFTLLMAYVQILLSVVLAPFWIIGGVVPGSPISLSGWLKNISANLLAFPVTIAMFMLGKVFMDIFGTSPATGQNFIPPLIGNPGEPKLIGSLIGLGIILMTPNVVNMLKAALKAPKTDTGLGKAIGAGIAPFKETASGTAAYYKKFPKMGEKEGFGGVIQRIFR